MRETSQPRRRGAWRAIACVLGVILTTLLSAPSASADSPNAPLCGPTRPGGPMCYFWASSYGGAQAGFVYNKPDLINPHTWRFNQPGLGGSGQQVANNAGSGHNRDSVCTVTIYYGANYATPSITLGPGLSHPTLGAVNNNNRSHRFSGPSGCDVTSIDIP